MMKRSRRWPALSRMLLGGALLLTLWLALFSLVGRVRAVRADSYQGRIGPDVDAQLAYIRTRLRTLDDAAYRQLGPVRAVFVHALYGFSRVNTVLLDPDNEIRRAEAIRELKWLLGRLRHPAITSGFIPTQVPYGVFYLGERNLILAGLLLIDPDPEPT